MIHIFISDGEQCFGTVGLGELLQMSGKHLCCEPFVLIRASSRFATLKGIRLRVHPN